MDGFYRGLETSLLGLAFLLGLGAALFPSLPGAPALPGSSVAPGTHTGEAAFAVSLPMITVTAEP